MNTILDCKIMCNAETKTNGRKFSEMAMILDGYIMYNEQVLNLPLTGDWYLYYLLEVFIICTIFPKIFRHFRFFPYLF